MRSTDGKNPNFIVSVLFKKTESCKTICHVYIQCIFTMALLMQLQVLFCLNSPLFRLCLKLAYFY